MRLHPDSLLSSAAKVHLWASGIEIRCKPDQRKAATDMLEEGNKAPAFTLPGDGGEVVKLSDHKGAPVVVYFYPKDNTPGCTKQAIAFTEMAADFKALDVAIVGISPDSAASHDKLVAKHNLGIRLGADEETKVAEKYGVWVEKSMYGRTYMGVERSTFLINAKGTIVKIWRKVRVKGHVDTVLEAARELL